MENLQFLLIIALSPLLQGVIKKMKAYCQGRKGASVFQPYWDLLKLFKKEMVISRTASWIFHAAPFIVFITAVVASMLVPVLTLEGGIFRSGDIIALIYTLALGRFFLALAGMDAGTAFGGEGSSREATLAILTEPVLLLVIFLAALSGGSTNLANLARSANLFQSPAHMLAFAAFYVALISETGRIPVDNPDTHLELTMIHEGMVLEYSGPYLSLMEWAHWIKQMLLFTVAFDLFFPYGILGTEGGNIFLSIGLYPVKLLVLGGAVALTESTRAKLRFFQLPSFLGGAFILALLSVITFIMLGG
jgi:formate hydrogenlyase subunit 4